MKAACSVLFLSAGLLLSAPHMARADSSANNRKEIEAVVDTFRTNVRIETDGDVAQVWFDYSFMEGSYRANWGKESWQLVRLESGWKIASVIWSQELNPTPPPKR